MEKKQEAGEFIPTRRDDVLARALGKKDRSGRALGVGSGVGIRALWGASERRATHLGEQEMEERLSQKLEDMVQARLLSLAQQMGFPVPSPLLSGEKSNPNMNNAPPSHQAEEFDPFSILTDVCECSLAVMLGGYKEFVADGTCHPMLTLDHTREMRPDCIKVSVDYCYPNYRGVPLPVPMHIMTMVGQDNGSFVQWPKDLVMLNEETMLKLRDEWNKGKTGHSFRAIETPEMSYKGVGSGHASNDPNNFVLTENALQNVSGKCSLVLKNYVDNAPPRSMFNLLCTTGTFGYDGTVQVTNEDITQLITGSWLNVSVIQVFIMALSDMCDHDDATMNSIGFMCPSMISHTMSKNNPTGVTRYMTHLMKTSSTRFILYPYHSEDHWTLMVICMAKREVYVFYSLHGKKTYACKSLLGIAFRDFKMEQGSSGFKLTWKSAKYPQQSDGLECGYYVMRYMLAIVQTHYGSDNLIEDYSRTRKFSDEEIAEVKDMWAEYFVFNVDSMS